MEFKGKHKNQWEVMSGDMKKQFRTLDAFLETTIEMYRNWLIEKAIYSPTAAKEFLPDELSGHLGSVETGKKNSRTQEARSTVWTV